MGFLDWFRRSPPIRDTGALATFMDQRAAFLAQKGIYEYSRARAGHYAKVLFVEQDFLKAAERSSWQAYPLALAMIGELVEGLLRPCFLDDRRAGLDALTALVLSLFDSHPVPPSLGQAPWSQARSELAHRMSLVGMHAPKPAKDIPENLAKSYFDLMPIHEKLRGRDFSTIRNYLRVTLCNIHDEFTRRVDARALVESLRASPNADAGERMQGSGALR